MQIIHRSVGEPAEGSLTRIHVSTNENSFSRLPLQRMNWNQFEGVMGPKGRPSWYTYVDRNICVDNWIFAEAISYRFDLHHDRGGREAFTSFTFFAS